jgi:hypothetical protein
VRQSAAGRTGPNDDDVIVFAHGITIPGPVGPRITPAE